MKIQGALLRESALARPYADSQPITVRELDLADPGPQEVLVRIEAAGLCHSDLSVVNGSRPRALPLVLGHEAAGIVERLGEGVTDLAVGDRVTMTFLPRCESCEACATQGAIPCTVGTQANTIGALLGGETRLSDSGSTVLHHAGVSGFATHAVVNRQTVVRVDSDVPADVAALLGCAVLTGGGAVLNVAKPQPGDSLMIVGLGGVGMAALIVALSLEGIKVIGVDMSADKLETATRLGAEEVYTPTEVAERGIRATHAVEAAGHPRALETAFAATSVGGRTVTVGLPAPDSQLCISPLTVTAEARSLIGSYLGSTVPSRDIPKYAELWRQGRLPIEQLISRRIRLEDLNEALDDLSDGTALRQIVEFP
jgi:alcohol dehydrogenase